MPTVTEARSPAHVLTLTCDDSPATKPMRAVILIGHPLHVKSLIDGGLIESLPEAMAFDVSDLLSEDVPSAVEHMMIEAHKEGCETLVITSMPPSFQCLKEIRRMFDRRVSIFKLETDADIFLRRRPTPNVDVELLRSEVERFESTVERFIRIVESVEWTRLKRVSCMRLEKKQISFIAYYATDDHLGLKLRPLS